MISRLKNKIKSFLFPARKPEKTEAKTKNTHQEAANPKKNSPQRSPRKNAPAEIRPPQPRNNNKKRKPERNVPVAMELVKVPLAIPPKPDKLVEYPQEEGKVGFTELPIANDILFGIQALGFKYCTPIQAKCLPSALSGRDVTGKALTGTGKTAAFLISSFTQLLNKPIPPEQRVNGAPRILILAPTRELAMQIHRDAEKLSMYSGLNNVVVFGGMAHKAQRQELERPVDLLVGTPGRIIDYCSTGALKLEHAEILIIDEADRMLDMGFIPDVKRIVARLPRVGERQTMFFSATLTDTITHPIKTWLKDPVQVEDESGNMVNELINQRFYAVPAKDKLGLLMWILEHEPVERMLVFVNRKDINANLTAKLRAYGIPCESLSGDVPQEKRIRILERFRSADIKIVVATDVAARGIHVDNVSHVVNYDLPEHPEDYVHRIGRTGRAGNTGISVSFVCEYGAYYLNDIEKFMGETVSSIQPEENMLHLDPLPPGSFVAPQRRMENRGGRRNSGGGNRRPPLRRR